MSHSRQITFAANVSFRRFYLFIASAFLVFGAIAQTTIVNASTRVTGYASPKDVPIPLLDADVLDQKVRSQNRMIWNLSPAGAASGVIIASPSRQNPDYYFHWVRDAAITFDQAIQIYRENPDFHIRAKMRNFIFDYMALNQRIQNDTRALTGLGEPKFWVDGTPFSGSWGRPQDDGPAMRALNFIAVYHMVIGENWPEKNQIIPHLYRAEMPANSLIKKDLEFVAHHWREASFDLWEEVQGNHFFTLMVQRKSLLLGADLAASLQDPGAAFFYRSEAMKMTAEIEKFWKAESGYIIATRYFNWSDPRRESRLDSAVLLGSILGDSGDGFMAPYDDRVLATLQRLRDAFRSIYYINNDSPLGDALGRYPEDTYDGYSTASSGNPWFICTQTAAEVYYRTYLHAKDIKQIKISETNLRFYQNLLKGEVSLQVGMRLSAPDALYGKLLKNLRIEGDKMLARTLYHKDEQGALSEQMNRFTGFMQGANDLTWSYASYLSAVTWRQLAQ